MPSPSKTRLAYQLIEGHSDEFSVQVMCRLLGVRVPDTMRGFRSRYLTEHKKMLGFSS